MFVPGDAVKQRGDLADIAGAGEAFEGRSDGAEHERVAQLKIALKPWAGEIANQRRWNHTESSRS